MRAKCSVCGEVFKMERGNFEMFEDGQWIESQEMLDHIKEHPECEDGYWDLIDLQTDFNEAHKRGVWGEEGFE